MLKSTLITLLRLLKDRELELLDQLIDTVLFKLPNRHTDSVRLFSYLKTLLIDLSDEHKLEKREVAQHLFGHRANPDTELRKAMSGLVGILKKFVLVKQVLLPQEDTAGEFLRNIQADLSLLHWLKTHVTQTPPNQKASFIIDDTARKNHLIIGQQYQILCDQTAYLPPKEGPFFNQRNYSEWLLSGFWREYEMFDYYSLQRQQKEQEKHLVKALSTLDLFYYQLKMSLTLHQQTNQMMRPIQKELETSLVQDQILHAQRLLEHLPIHLKASQSIQLYAATHAMLLQDEQSEIHYQKIEELISSGQTTLPDEIILNIRAMQRVYCSLMYNRTGASIYLQRNFVFFTENLEREIKQQGGGINALSFSAAISNALRLGEQSQEWVIHFLERFKNGVGILDTETPREVYKINRAHLLLYQRAFREASNELIGYEWYGRIDEPQILLLAIRIDLKTQIEMGHYDDDYTHRTLNNVEKRISRLTGIDQQQSDMTLQFLRLIKQMCPLMVKLKISLIPDDINEKIDKWEKEIRSEPIAEKAWLLHKISDIKAFLK
jgi:hypothetical protein